MTVDAVAARTPGSGAVARAFARSPRTFWRPLLLLVPTGCLLGLLAVCSLLILRLSLGERNAEWASWTLASYSALFDRYYLVVVFDTLWLALLSAIVTSAIAFPIALYMTRTPSPVMQRAVLIAVMLPMVVSLLVQSFGWMAILGPAGLVNRAGALLTGQGRAVSLLFNRTGVLLGLVQTTIPLAVLPIAASLRTIPIELEEAASVLGASRLGVYRSIILPLAWPGIAAGAVLVFGFNTGAFVVPLLLGGLKVATIAVLIRNEMGPLLNWPLGASLSVVLVALALGIQTLNRVIAPGRQNGGRA
jgi:putative spermidine/putrescine transport system permease protein